MFRCWSSILWLFLSRMGWMGSYVGGWVHSMGTNSMAVFEHGCRYVDLSWHALGGPFCRFWYTYTQQVFSLFAAFLATLGCHFPGALIKGY